MIRLLCTAPLIAAMLLMVGCDDAAEKKSVSASASKWMLDSQPEDALTPTEIKESMAEVEGAMTVTLVGSVNAGEVSPFVDGQAQFMVSQMAEKGHAEGDPDHVDNCPFCKRKLKNAPRAIVQFTDDQGKAVSTDSRDLFGIDKGSVVYVVGEATFDEKLNTIQINGKSIFIL